MRFFNWIRTFKGALTMACFCLFAMFMALSGDEVSPGWAIIDAICVLYWVNVARLASKQGNTRVELTRDQKRRIDEAVAVMGRVIEEVEAEVKAEDLARKLKEKKGDE